MKKHGIRRSVALSMVGAMSLSLLSGCGSKEEVPVAAKTEAPAKAETAAPTEAAAAPTEAADGFEHDPILNELGADQVCKEKVTISVGVKQSVNVEDYETNWYTQMLEEAANVDLEFVVFPAEGADDKLRLMVTGGEELPDIIMWKQSDAQAMVWGEEGYLLPLEDYFENSSYYAAAGYERLKENGGLDIIDYMTLSDGHIWSFPQYQETLTNPPYARMYVWKPWLDALGLEAPTNTEEFYEMLVAFKTQDPNGNGLADEIPMIGCDITSEQVGCWVWEFIMNSFTQSSSKMKWLVSEDGQLSVSYTKDEFKEGVKFISKLVEEGLYDPISFTQNYDTYRTFTKRVDHVVGVMVEMTLNQVEQTTQNNWLLLSTLDGPDGTSSVAYKADVPVNRAYITADCEHPEVAFRILDLMCREDFTITSRWGKQGENWDYVANLNEEEIEKQASEAAGTTVEYDWENVTFAGYPAYFYEYKNIWGKPQNNHWYNEAVVFRTAEITAGYNAATLRTDEETLSTAAGSYSVGQYLEDIADNVPKEPITRIKYTNLDAQLEAEEIEEELVSYVYEKLGAWFTGMSDVEADWDAYLADLEKIGLSRYLELSQEGWKK